MKQYSLDEAKDILIGKPGSKDREEYECELKLSLIGDMIKQVRKKRNLTQSELGEMIGVKKAQISRLENNNQNITVETMLRIFQAMNAEIDFRVRI